ncbi:MAG: endonuclease/exonuclease/phosphatase family protein [Clostridia bacterium]|nr:endonuclease/exonuclease/phosphatase family protein [Clostridia bacterium]
MKRAIALVLMFMLMFSFSACGDEEVSSVTSTISAVSSKTETVSSSAEESSEQSVSSVESTPVVSAETETESKPTQEEGIMLKVASYNIANGSKCGHNMQLIANDITSKDIDIVGFQEIDRLSGRSQNLDTMKVLSELTGYKYYTFVKAIDLPASIGGEYGIGILSKYPITNEASKQINSFGYEQRVVQMVEITVQGKKVNLFNTHFTYNTAEARTSQFAEVEEFMKGKKNCLLTGDFNVEAISEFDQVKSLSKVNNQNNQLASWIPNDGWPTKCIDNIMYDKGFKLVSSAVDTNQHSDHFMIYAQFEIK